MIQSNWVCKAAVNVRYDKKEIEEEQLPPGRLRAVQFCPLEGGSADSDILLRIPSLNLPDNALYPVHLTANDWIGFDGTGEMAVFYCDLYSDAGIEVQWCAVGQDESNPAQFSFWYEPIGTDDDSRLAPLGSVDRGGVRRGPMS